MNDLRQRAGAGGTDLDDGSRELSAELKQLLALRAALREQARSAGLPLPPRTSGGDEEGGDADSDDLVAAAGASEEVQDCLPLAAAALGVCVGVPAGVAALAAGATPATVATSALAVLAAAAAARVLCLPRSWAARRSRVRAADVAASAVAATAAGALLALATGMRIK